MSGAGTNLKEFPLPTFKFVPADQRHSLCVGNFFVLPSGADSMARAPHFYKWLGTGGTMSRRTANKKLTKALTKTTNCAFRAKKWRGTTKNIFHRFFVLDQCLPHFCSGPVHPHFQIRSSVTGRTPPLFGLYKYS